MNAKKSHLRRFLDHQTAAPLGESLQIEQLMTGTPVSVRPESTARDLIDLFSSLKIRHLLVVNDEGALVGLVSDLDIVRCFGLHGDPSDQELQQVQARHLMSHDLITVSPEETVLHGVQLMLLNGISSLPVVRNNIPVGIVTATDMYVLLEELLESHQPAVAETCDVTTIFPMPTSASTFVTTPTATEN